MTSVAAVPAKSRRLPATARPAPPEPDLDRALALVLDLMAIPGTSGQEGPVSEAIVRELRKAGAPASAIRRDSAHEHSPHGGQVGNLIFTLPGTVRGPRRLLMAHLDTVPLCVGAKPVRKGKLIVSADRTTGLGGDDRAGCAVVLTAALEILRRKLPHPPLTFFWPVQEEIGLFGVHYGDLKLLGNPALAFNWDGSGPDKLCVGATGAYRLTIDIRGLASHAGVAPEQGISAITIAALAIAGLHREGWLGDVRQGRRRGTSNVGVISGGAATNVVTDHVQIRAECRSHDAKFRRRMLQAITTAFEDAARGVKNSAGVTGKVKVSSQLDYESFELPKDDPSTLAAAAVVRSLGLDSVRRIANGGLDANWMTARGVPTVTLGCGQQDVHTIKESLDIASFQTACRIALRLATAV